MFQQTLLNFLERLNAWQIRQRFALLESVGYFALALLWMLLVPPDYPGRFLLGRVIVAAPAVAAALQVWFSHPSLPAERREAWLYLGLALAGWALRHLAWVFLGLAQGFNFPLSLADLFGLLAYPLAALGLFKFPSGFRHAPSRFRFFLDMIINAGAAAALGWLLLDRAFPVGPAQFIPMLYPIADLVLLTMVVTLALTGGIIRSSASMLGASLVALTLSDYANSILTLYQSDPSGSVFSLGWVLAYLLVGNEVIRERRQDRPSARPPRPARIDLGRQMQNILPVTLVLALAWYVLADWRLRGQLSLAGLVMSLLFAAILIVRLGIRAGEVELQRYWQLFSSLAEPAFICDTRGRILLGNPALARLDPGAGEDDLRGRDLGAFFAAPSLPPDWPARASHSAVTEEVTRVGAQTPYLLTLSPIRAEGRRGLIAGVAHDLSEQKQQQDALRQAFSELQAVHRRLEGFNAELEARVEERTHTLREAYARLEDQHRQLQELDGLKTDFVSMVSHELRTPLNNLGGGLELMLSRAHTSPTDRETMQLMQHEILRLTRFVESILNLSALEAGRFELRPLPLSLSVAAEEVLRKRFGAGQERIVNDISPDLPLVLTDEAALQSVLHHLLDNALKYAPHGPVIIRAALQAGCVRVEVQDQGPGIPEDKRHLLYRKFQRLEARDSQSVYGYGLGLYLSRRLLEAMQSDLSYESPAQGGACFYFTLKVAQ
ncbi:MAG: ATP-binding protein [Chloroflexota bacterium]